MKSVIFAVMLFVSTVSMASATVTTQVIHNGSGVLVQSIQAKGGTGIIVTTTALVPGVSFGSKLACDKHFAEYDVTKTPTTDFPAIKSYVVHACTPAY